MNGIELPPDDPWVARGYGQGAITPGLSAVLVVDLQYAFTDPAFPMGGAASSSGRSKGPRGCAPPHAPPGCRCSRRWSPGARTGATSVSGR